MVSGLVAWHVLLQLVPFVFAIAIGFMYNMVCDAPYDSAAKIPSLKVQSAGQLCYIFPFC
jgi:hypothetical protein